MKEIKETEMKDRAKEPDLSQVNSDDERKKDADPQYPFPEDLKKPLRGMHIRIPHIWR